MDNLTANFEKHEAEGYKDIESVYDLKMSEGTVYVAEPAYDNTGRVLREITLERRGEGYVLVDGETVQEINLADLAKDKHISLGDAFMEKLFGSDDEVSRVFNLGPGRPEYRLKRESKFLAIDAMGEFITLLRKRKATAALYRRSSRAEYAAIAAEGKTVPEEKFFVRENFNNFSDLPWFFTDQSKCRGQIAVSETGKYDICRLPSASASLDVEDDTATLNVSLRVTADENSFCIDPSEAGTLQTQGIAELINQPHKALPFIKFPLLSYLYSLPWSRYPETLRLRSNILSKPLPDGSSELMREDVGEIKLSRYFGWCRPLLTPAPRVPVIWGTVLREDVMTILDNPLFLNENRADDAPLVEKRARTIYGKSGAETAIEDKPMPEIQWYNASRMIWLPDTVTASEESVNGFAIGAKQRGFDFKDWDYAYSLYRPVYGEPVIKYVLK